jgi:hypothetical protein
MMSFPRFRVARLAMLATLLGGSVLGSACVADQDFLIVDRAVWFDDRDNCVLSDSSATPLALAVDVKFDTQIGMGFVVTNNQESYEGSNSGIDDSEVKMETAEVSLSFSGGGVAGSSFEVQLPTNAIPGGESEVFLVRIPTSVTESLRSTMQGLPETAFETLEMEVIFKGRRSGQVGNSKLGSIETRPYIYPFDICHGCLETCQLGASCDGGADLCPTATDWDGACGFAQGVSVVHSTCEAP